MGIVTKFFCTILCVAAQYWYISIPVGLLVLLKMYNQMSMGIYKKGTMMNGKTVIITGANSGLGEVTALDMASRGARVIMACRDLGKANGVRGEI
ncbi:retinol dehydrogenase 11-like [Diaphorina citri]|uniref:Retinol dehydrogenase 11-like n=1 Tax=Diaphorina citri TaxID=121845 RepID=A0A3Q0IWW2_DIACI|nr:retinol dehydrogenase 11-like [Diaphorina citri]